MSSSIPEKKTIKLSDVVFDQAVYPRQAHDPQLVQQYATDMLSIEAHGKFMSVSENMRLIDGRHRHLAYLTLYLDDHDHEVTVFVYPVSDDKEVFKLASEMNSGDGWQMTQEDKQRAAIKMYGDYQETQSEIARALKVRKEKVNSWLKAVLDSEKKDRERKIWEMWLQCCTQQEIADKLEMTQRGIGTFLQKKAIEFQGNDSSNFSDFEPQLYTTWNFSKLTNKTKIFGSIPQEILDNLLYYYTEPFNVIFDPFAGGGMTIDVCKKRKRRYYVSDLSPIPARQDEINKWDITEGLPDNLPVPDLVFLDPPYWRQARKQYSEKETDLGNTDLETFLNTIASIAKTIKRKWGNSRPNARLALIIGAWKNEGQYLDLPFLCYKIISKYLTLAQRIQVPYSTQIHGGNYVKMAKESKELLYLSRDLMIFKQEGKQDA